MDLTKTAELILEKWIASLKNRDRSKDAVAGNFDELFSDLKRANISFNDAHALLEPATKAHFPKKAVVKNVWKNSKALHEVFSTESEFEADWNQTIKAHAVEAFFANYPLKLDEDDDDEPKIYGNMSAKEYRAQRQYVEKFPILDTDKLIKEMKERQNLSGNLKDVLGLNKDE